VVGAELAEEGSLMRRGRARKLLCSVVPHKHALTLDAPPYIQADYAPCSVPFPSLQKQWKE
jgi:hypothetical protein